MDTVSAWLHIVTADPKGFSWDLQFLQHTDYWVGAFSTVCSGKFRQLL